MDVITRAEFNDYMKDIPTKEQLLSALAGPSADIMSIKDRLNDIKVDVLDAIDTKMRETRVALDLRSATTNELNDTKVEILATTRRNLADAIAPLATKMDAGFSKIDASHQAIHKSHDEIKKSIKDLTHFVMEGMGAHENRLKDREGA